MLKESKFGLVKELTGKNENVFMRSLLSRPEHVFSNNNTARSREGVRKRFWSAGSYFLLLLQRSLHLVALWEFFIKIIKIIKNDYDLLYQN